MSNKMQDLWNPFLPFWFQARRSPTHDELMQLFKHCRCKWFGSSIQGLFCARYMLNGSVTSCHMSSEVMKFCFDVLGTSQTFGSFMSSKGPGLLQKSSQNIFVLHEDTFCPFEVASSSRLMIGITVWGLWSRWFSWLCILHVESAFSVCCLLATRLGNPCTPCCTHFLIFLQ